VTVATILVEAEVSRASFYKYYDSKHAVLIALLRRIFDEVPVGVPADGQEVRVGLVEAMAIWAEHGGVVRAAVECMHVVPEVGSAWREMLARLVEALAEQIRRERHAGRAPDGAPAETLAIALLDSVERVFYVASNGLEPRLASATDAIPALDVLTAAAVYGAAVRERGPASLRVGPTPRDGHPAAGATAPVLTASATARSTPAPPAPTATETEASILRAMRGLLQDRSFDEVSVEHVLEAAGVSRATFYFYFGGKDDAFVALLADVFGGIVDDFGSAVAAAASAGPGAAGDAVTEWLRLGDASRSAIRNAVHEWPRRPEIRRLYLAGVGRMASGLEALIDAERAAGRAPAGVPSPELAAVVLWSIERVLAGSLGGEPHLQDPVLVTGLLGDVFVAAIYGHPTR
jgi:AcrR family transcriptional regulator